MIFLGGDRFFVIFTFKVERCKNNLRVSYRVIKGIGGGPGSKKLFWLISKQILCTFTSFLQNWKIFIRLAKNGWFYGAGRGHFEAEFKRFHGIWSITYEKKPLPHFVSTSIDFTQLLEHSWGYIWRFMPAWYFSCTLLILMWLKYSRFRFYFHMDKIKIR